MESETIYTYSGFEIAVALGFFTIYIFATMLAAFIVGKRRGVRRPGIAFVPLFGPWIVILRSIGTSLWWILLLLIPYVGLGFVIWAAFVVPARHERTRWWTLPFLIPVVNVVAFIVYALTLTPVPAGSGDVPDASPSALSSEAAEAQEDATEAETTVGKYCIECGHPLHARARFCSRCGTATDPATA